jgi:Sec-independent protein translocase protein TatA
MPSGLTPTHVMVFLLVALLVLGPHRLLDGARQAGKFVGEFRRWSEDIKREVRSVSTELHNGEPTNANGNGANGNGHAAQPAADGTAPDAPPRFGIGPFARPEHFGDS